MAKTEKKTNKFNSENQEKFPSKPNEILSARSLDVAEEASASVRELNNVILKLKPIVKQAKSRTIQKIVRQIQKLKKTKGSDEKVEKSRSKAERLLDEIYTIKSLELEQLAQYSLGNTTSFFHLSSQRDVPVEIKAMTRVSENPQVQQYVKTFRANHKDWEKLGDFMLFKQSGRRYKHATSENRVERIKASEALVKTYINKKFSGDKDKIKKVELISEHVLTKPRKFPKDDTSDSLKDSETTKPTKDAKGPKTEKRKLFKSIIAQNDSDEKDDNAETSKSKSENEQKLVNESLSLDKKSNSKLMNKPKVSNLPTNLKKKSTILKDPELSESDQSESDSNSEESDVDNQVISIKVKKGKVTNDEMANASDSDDSEESDASDDSAAIPDNQVTNNTDNNSDSESADSDSDPQSDDSGINTKTLPKSKIQKISQKMSSKNIIEKSKNEKMKKKKVKEKPEKETKTVKSPESVKTNGTGSDDDFVIKKNNDMVVRKIDWDNFGIGSDFRPSFNKNIPEVKKRRQKNDFFENDDDEFDDDNDDDDNDEKDVVREDDKEEIKGYGRSLMESAFVKSLGGGPKLRPVIDRERKKLVIQIKREMNSKKKQQEKKDSRNRQPQTKPGKHHQQNKGHVNKGFSQTENVHPSWAASLKRKQEQGALSAFQGKKIKFDD